MNDGIRRAALRSAAKVAFGASLCWGVTVTACGGKSVGGEPSSTDDGEDPGGGDPPPNASGGSATAGSSWGGGEARGSAGGSVASGGAVATGGGAGEVIGGSSGADAGVPDTAAEPLACVAPFDSLDAGVETAWRREDFACCSDYIASRIPDGGVALDLGAAAADPSFVNCCRFINASYYELRDDGGPGEELSGAGRVCCNPQLLSLDEIFDSFCTPWGPPVPPAFDAELEAVA